MSLSGITYTVSNTILKWNNASALTTIEFKTLPTVTLSKLVGERLDLISNSSSQNRVILPFSVQITVLYQLTL